MHPRLSINKVCFLSRSNAEFIEAARGLGAHNVVLLSSDLLADGALAETQRLLGADGPRVASIQHPFALHPDLDRDEGMAAANLMAVVAVAEQLGADSVYMVTGGRGGLGWEAAAARFAELVTPVASSARERGIDLLIETTNPLYVDRHIAHTLADTIALVELADIGICLELFYIWGERDLAGQFRRSMPRCGLVQLSDFVLGERTIPCRAVPGDGVVPLRSIVGDLLDAGYDGLFDLEILGPRIDAEGHLAATSRGIAHLESILAEYGA